MSSSEDENTHVSSEDDSEYLSDASKDSFVSTTEDFVPYDESIEPVAKMKLPNMRCKSLKRKKKNKCFSADSLVKSTSENGV